MSYTVAIMQPYIFPNIGYFCLTEASNVFVFYDDVNFITRGWINRNRILINGSPYKFTVPLSSASQNKLICDIKIHMLEEFRNKFLKQIQVAYSRAPYYESGYQYVAGVMQKCSSSISDIAINSIKEFYSLIGKKKEFIRSSEVFESSRGTNKSDRLIAITKSLNSAVYVNAIGGFSLYNKSYFIEKGVRLYFIKPRITEYKQIGYNDFIPGLSIIDVIMNNDIDTISNMIRNYELL